MRKMINQVKNKTFNICLTKYLKLCWTH